MRRESKVSGLGPARLRGARGALLLPLVLLAAVAGAEAQPQIFGNRFNFNFSNPGARSLGFGGAFAALADDATASYANPAGLVQLTRPEVSVEWRLWDQSPAFVAGGRVAGEPTGVGLDTVRGLLFGRDHSRSTSPSFLSAVMPRGNWSFAVYGHRLARFQMTSESQGFFFDVIEDEPGTTFRFPASREQVELEVVTGGLAAGWRMNDRLRFGLGLVHSDISLSGDTSFYTVTSSEDIFEEIPVTPANLFANDRTRIDGTDLTVNAGALWSATDRLSAGFFYRQGATAKGTRVAGVQGVFEISGRARFAVPDVWGAGLAYRSAGGALTLAGEIDRVGYDGLLRIDSVAGEEVDGREYRDAWEYHLGAEYALLHRRPILAFRVGGWVEANGDDIIEDRFTHLAVGFGLAADRFQIDVAADFSKEIDTGSISFIYSF